MTSNAAIQPRQQWRRELDGLRAIAIALVISFHLWGSGVSGGVDIFFVLSGYFLVQNAVKQLSSTRGYNVRAYWSRTFLRLLVPLALVLTAVTIGAALALPASRWPDLLPQLRASALGVQNMWLAQASVDYYAARSASLSPVQHLWSVSLQMQIFLLFPLAMIATWWFARRTAVRPLWALVTLLIVATVLSAWHASAAVRLDPAPAYFWTSTRLWEFTLGGLAGLAPSLITGRRSAWCADVVAWFALVTVLAGPFIWGPAARFPGPVAAIPTCASALFLIATRPMEDSRGIQPHRLSVVTVLGSRLFRAVGRQSFGLYLWHWPLLTFCAMHTGQAKPNITTGAAIVVVSFLAALATSQIVDVVIRPMERIPMGQVVGVASAVATTAAVITGANAFQRQQAPSSVVATAATNAPTDSSEEPALAFAPFQRLTDLKPTPHMAVSADLVKPRPEDLHDSWFLLDSECSAEITSQPIRQMNVCRMNAPAKPQRHAWTLVGDSHMQQFGPAILVLAHQHDASLRSYIQGGCRFPAFPTSGPGFPECRNFVNEVQQEILANLPDVIFMVGTRSTFSEPGESVVPGVAEVARELAAHDVDVVLFRDNPRFKMNPYECGELRGWGHAQCVNVLPEGVPATNPLEEIAAMSPRIHAVDNLLDICPDRRCAPTQGNLAVFMDDNHLSTPFAESLAPSIERQLIKSGLIADKDVPIPVGASGW